MTGIIFDFNGTLVSDSHLHEQAWVDIIQKYRPEKTAKEIIAYIHGRTTDKTIAHFLGEVSDEDYQKIVKEKELDYQAQVKKEQLRLIEGTEEFLDYLVKNKVPFTIATASPKLNVDFYFSYFNLGRWFNPTRVIYDDDTFPGKPEPDIYIKAAELIGYKPADCIVFEDAVTGIKSANAAGIKEVYVMVESEEKTKHLETDILHYKQIITNFYDVSELFNKNQLITK